MNLDVIKDKMNYVKKNITVVILDENKKNRLPSLVCP